MNKASCVARAGRLSRPVIARPFSSIDVINRGHHEGISVEDQTASLETGKNIVPWYPKTKQDLQEIGTRILRANIDIPSDHPGFHDPEYRKRRDFIAKVAEDYVMGDELPFIDYTKEETDCWGFIYGRLSPMYKNYACPEFNEVITKMEKFCEFSLQKVPQLKNISDFLSEETGWALKPACGLLTQREFLNSLAFKVFHCTQYMRHHSDPFYTPEPDVSHEVIGHAPMFANPEFAELSQVIGLASLGACDEDIARLGTLYWFTVEFGLVKSIEDGSRKAYGAGVLSSIGEMENSMFGDVSYIPLDSKLAAGMDYPSTTVQPIYTLADSFESARDNIFDFGKSIKKPFIASFDSKTGMVVTRPSQDFS